QDVHAVNPADQRQRQHDDRDHREDEHHFVQPVADERVGGVGKTANHFQIFFDDFIPLYQAVEDVAKIHVEILADVGTFDLLKILYDQKLRADDTAQRDNVRPDERQVLDDLARVFGENLFIDGTKVGSHFVQDREDVVPQPVDHGVENTAGA